MVRASGTMELAPCLVQINRQQTNELGNEYKLVSMYIDSAMGPIYSIETRVIHTRIHYVYTLPCRLEQK